MSTRTTGLGERLRRICAAGLAMLLVSCGSGGGGGAGGSEPPAPQALAPTIATAPQPSSVAVGASASFSVSATGDAPLSFQWKRDGADIAGATTASYTTPAAALADNGAAFSVVVSNAAGSVTSAAATLSVTGAAAGGYFMLGEVGSPSPAGTLSWFNGTVPVKRYALAAVAADNPSTPVVVEPAGAWAEVGQWVEGTLTGNEWTELRTRFRAYAKGNRFYVVDQVVAGPGAPTGRLWTTLTPAEACRNSVLPNGMQSVGDPLDARRSYHFVFTPGADAQCGTPDDQIRALRVGMTGSEPAPTVDEPIATIITASDSIAGFLTRSGTRVRRVDANFGNAVDAFVLNHAVTPPVTMPLGTSAPGTWLYLDGSDVYAYSLDGSSLPTLVLSLAAGESITGRGGALTETYWAITGPAGTRIVAIGTSLAVRQVTSTSDAPNNSTLLVSPTHLVFKVGNQIRSVARAGGTVTTLVDGGSDWTVGGFWLSGESVFVSVTAFAPTRHQVRLVNTNGTNAQTIDNARFFSLVPKNPLPTLLTEYRLNAVYDTIVLAEEILNAPYLPGAALRAYEGSTRALRVTYGTLPAVPSNLGSYPQDGFPPLYGKPGLLQLYESGNYGVSNLDLVSYNSGAAGLNRLTANLR